MVQVTKNKLIIEIESKFPALLLRDLQESLVMVLRRYSEDWHVDRFDDLNCLVMLLAMLPSSEDYEKIYS